MHSKQHRVGESSKGCHAPAICGKNINLLSSPESLPWDVIHLKDVVEGIMNGMMYFCLQAYLAQGALQKKPFGGSAQYYELID